MRKLLTWVVVTVGIAALVRKLRRRGEGGEPASESEGEDPAEELRRKLASSREEASPATAADPEPETTVDERRADVHAQGRAAIDEMQRSTE